MDASAVAKVHEGELWGGDMKRDPDISDDRVEENQPIDHTLGGFVNPAGDYCDPEDILPVSDGWQGSGE